MVLGTQAISSGDALISIAKLLSDLLRSKPSYSLGICPLSMRLARKF